MIPGLHGPEHLLIPEYTLLEDLKLLFDGLYTPAKGNRLGRTGLAEQERQNRTGRTCFFVVLF
jgi:hypothetical protein